MYKCLTCKDVCRCQEKKNDISIISAEDLKREMAVNPELIVINVLGQASFEDCHIKGSVNIPLEELKDYAEAWDKHEKIVVYCAHHDCKASKNAYNFLKDLGFRNIHAYEGGIREWKQKGYPTVGECKMDYLKK